jgi:enoyl-CoA hydratase/carnithine racemase
LSPLAVARDGAVTRLRLARGDKANALDAALVDALLAAVGAAANDGTRLLVIEGDGRNFSAGFDFGGYEQATQGDLLLRFVRIEQLLQAVYHAPFATLALAHGRNFGAGADLFVACAIRVAAHDATFRMPGLRFGVQLGTRRLASRIGAEAARAMLAESRTLDGPEALEIGFVHRLEARDDWESIVQMEAGRATQLAPGAAARLAAATVTDTRAADMADLVASVAEPGLAERIKAYRDSR